MIPEMTAQQIFDKVAAHLLKQNKQAKAENGRCRYRTIDNLSCAIGCLIPDDYYHEELESNSVTNLLQLGKLPNWMLQHQLLLSELQLTHDNILPHEWRDALADVAASFRLDPAILNATEN